MNRFFKALFMPTDITIRLANGTVLPYRGPKYRLLTFLATCTAWTRITLWLASLMLLSKLLFSGELLKQGPLFLLVIFTLIYVSNRREDLFVPRHPIVGASLAGLAILYIILGTITNPYAAFIVVICGLSAINFFQRHAVVRAVGWVKKTSDEMIRRGEDPTATGLTFTKVASDGTI